MDVERACQLLADLGAQTQMLRPKLRARVEERDRIARRRINARCVSPFVSVAIRAGQGEIFDNRGSAVDARKHMVDRERRDLSSTWKATILATVAGAMGHRPSKM